MHIVIILLIILWVIIWLVSWALWIIAYDKGSAFVILWGFICLNIIGLIAGICMYLNFLKPYEGNNENDDRIDELQNENEALKLKKEWTEKLKKLDTQIDEWSKERTNDHTYINLANKKIKILKEWEDLNWNLKGQPVVLSDFYDKRNHEDTDYFSLSYNGVKDHKGYLNELKKYHTLHGKIDIMFFEMMWRQQKINICSVEIKRKSKESKDVSYDELKEHWEKIDTYGKKRNEKEESND